MGRFRFTVNAKRTRRIPLSHDVHFRITCTHMVCTRMQAKNRCRFTRPILYRPAQSVTAEYVRVKMNRCIAWEHVESTHANDCQVPRSTYPTNCITRDCSIYLFIHEKNQNLSILRSSGYVGVHRYVGISTTCDEPTVNLYSFLNCFSRDRLTCVRSLISSINCNRCIKETKNLKN